jgi:hypothetical protein
MRWLSGSLGHCTLTAVAVRTMVCSAVAAIALLASTAAPAMSQELAVGDPPGAQVDGGKGDKTDGGKPDGDKTAGDKGGGKGDKGAPAIEEPLL